ncbi:hypothetical protein Tco_0874677 [Tanacetum coccineum]|uniref:Uncharacterized protein n=1 Tax=Tanacetum coccineum TaxID=301880 RepID=A0ABQ5BMP6_9ASTR
MSRMHQRNEGYPFDSLVDFACRFYGTNLSKAIGDGESIKFYNDHGLENSRLANTKKVTLNLEEGNTEFWRQRFSGECLEPELQRSTDIEVKATNVFDDKTDVAEDSGQQVDYDEADREEVVEQTENQAGDTEAVKDKEAAAYSLQMIGGYSSLLLNLNFHQIVLVLI